MHIFKDREELKLQKLAEILERQDQRDREKQMKKQQKAVAGQGNKVNRFGIRLIPRENQGKNISPKKSKNYSL
jgi:hypothetical protein